jgi:hypothetical protein
MQNYAEEIAKSKQTVKKNSNSACRKWPLKWAEFSSGRVVDTEFQFCLKQRIFVIVSTETGPPLPRQGSLEKLEKVEFSGRRYGAQDTCQ